MVDLAATGLAYLEGLALVVSPCILPILPIILSGSASGSKQRPLGIITGFMASFIIFTLASRFFVQSLGLDLELVRQLSYWLILVFGLVLFSSTLSNGFARLTQGLANLGNKFTVKMPANDDFFSGMLLGLCIGLIWTPCAGPILAAVIVQSIRQSTNFQSILVVIAFAFGAGTALLPIALGGAEAMQRLGFFKRHSETIRKVMGIIIIATVLFTAKDTLFPQLAQGGSGFNIFGNNAPKKTTSNATRLENALSKPYAAPQIKGIDQWFNSAPLTLSQLKGKVVLVDFWTYSCINCIRTLPYITQWDAKYKDKGLVILGIHAPEFEFEKNPANVKRAIQKFGIKYPVALDNKLDTWTSFNNSYWPAHYLIDKKGNVVYTHFGEGEYDVTEQNIRYLLGINGTNTKTQPAPLSSSQTPETYLGTGRADRYSGSPALNNGKTITYASPASLSTDHWALTGPWAVTSEKATAKAAGASLKMHFKSKNVFLVLGGSSKASIKASILLNGKPVNTFGGKDVKGGMVTVDSHALYDLVKLNKPGEGVVEIKANTPGLEAYAFTFGS